MTIEEMDLTTANSACDHWLEIRYNLIGQTGPRLNFRTIALKYIQKATIFRHMYMPYLLRRTQMRVIQIPST